MNNYFKRVGYLLTIVISVIGLVVLYVPQSIASTSAVPLSAARTFDAHLVLRPIDMQFDDTQLAQASQIIGQRLAMSKLHGPFNVQVRSNYITVELSEGRDIPYVSALITTIGDIQFIQTDAAERPLGQNVALNDASTLFTGGQVNHFTAPTDGDMFYQLTLNQQATQQLDVFDKTQSNQHICMVMDNVVVNCSSMYYWSGDSLEIVPNLRSNHPLSMQALLTFVHSGALPLSLEIVD